jgi:transcriptional regulator with XRE-family HTH domain
MLTASISERPLVHKTRVFIEALEDVRRRKGWTLEEIAEKLAVSPRTLLSWLKPAARSPRKAPGWAILALMALAWDRAVTERRGAVEITYQPVKPHKKGH